MGINCISKRYLRGEDLEQFNKLQDHFKWSDGLTAAMIGAWQTFTNSKNDAFPAIHELETFSGKYTNMSKDLSQVPFVQRYQKLKDLLNELRHQHLMDEEFHTELTAYKPKQRNQIRTILNEIGSKYGFRITVEDHSKYHPYKPEIFGLHNLRINGVDPESLYKEYETYYQQLWADYQKTLKVDEYYSNLTDDEILSNEALKAQEWKENSISYEGINVLSFKNKRCLILNEKDSQAFSNYLTESKGVLPKEFVLLNSGLTLVKSNNRRNSRLYTIVNKYGEVLYEKYPVYTKDEYDILKEKRKEAMEGPSGLYLDKLPSIRHSLAFRKFITSPSKGLFKKSAKDFLRNYIKANYEAEKIPINMGFIDRFVDQFPDSFWNSVITNTLALNRLYSKRHSGRLGLTTRGTATSYALEEYTMPLTISKRRLLTLIEKELNKEGKSIYGKFSFEGPINEICHITI